jgi:hypothetical protein
MKIKSYIPFLVFLLFGLGVYLVYMAYRNPVQALTRPKLDAYKVLEGYLQEFIKNAQEGKIGDEFKELIQSNAENTGISFEGAAAQAWIFLEQEKGAIVDGKEVPREVFNALYFNYVR